jgi:hypothetical protein
MNYVILCLVLVALAGVFLYKKYANKKSSGNRDRLDRHPS